MNNIFDNKQLDNKQFLISDLKCLIYFKTDSFKLYKNKKNNIINELAKLFRKWKNNR